MTCKCSHDLASHRKGGDCLALVSLNGVFCRCKQFVEAPTMPIERDRKPVAALERKKGTQHGK